MASIAAMQPTVPDTAPKTGNSRRQAAGGSGVRQARHGVRPGTIHVKLASRSIALLGYLTFARLTSAEDWGNGFAAKLIRFHTWMILSALCLNQLAFESWRQGEAAWWLAANGDSPILGSDRSMSPRNAAASGVRSAPKL